MGVQALQSQQLDRIAVFDEADIKGILLKGTQAAIARSEEMARGE